MTASHFSPRWLIDRKDSNGLITDYRSKTGLRICTGGTGANPPTWRIVDDRGAFRRSANNRVLVYKSPEAAARAAESVIQELDTDRVIVPPGTYILGDPCYAIPDRQWDEAIDSYEASSSGCVGKVNGVQFMRFGTQYGDGRYDASDGSQLSVDSGTIGLVPVSMPEVTRAQGHTTLVTFTEPALCTRSRDGLLTFGHVTVDTDPSSDDEED